MDYIYKCFYQSYDMDNERILFKNLIKYQEEKIIRGALYSIPDDFIVREIPLDKSFIGDSSFDDLSYPRGKEDKFVRCTLVKRELSDFKVIEELSNFLGISYEDIGYHGLKDTFGLTIQQISLPSKIYIENLSRLKNKKFKGFFMKNATFSSSPCVLREIFGNHFTVTIREFEGNETKIRDQLDKFFRKNNKFPSFYGHQRFGIRQNNHIIGKQIIKRSFDKAIKIFCLESANEPTNNFKTRETLKKNWGNWEVCYNLVKDNPDLDYEKKIFNHLMVQNDDYEGAVNKIKIFNFCVNSYSSYLFNKILINLIDRKIEIDYLPLIGYAINLNNELIRLEYEKIFQSEGITKDNFKNICHANLSFPGRVREAFYKVDDFKFEVRDNSIVLEFSLPMGVYANLFLEQIIKNKSRKNKLE